MSDSEDDFMVDDESDFDEEPVLVTKSIKTKASTKAPAKKKVTATANAATKKKTKSITVDSDDDDDDDDDDMPVSAPTVLSERSVNTPSKTKKKKTVEDTYKKMSQLEHILIRPDTYSK